jgi:hypothetical protein
MADAEFKADCDRLHHNLAGAVSLVCSYVKDGTRHFFTAGDVDSDAEAGFMARCLASKANEDYS